VPKEKAEGSLEIIKKNGEYANIIADTKTGPFVIIDGARLPANTGTTIEENGHDYGTVESSPSEEDLPIELLDKLSIQKKQIDSRSESKSTSTSKSLDKPKVFISHGKNRKIVEQMKELLTFGQFEPVVSIERETTAIPVPDKVFSDMNGCHAGIIHIEGEQHLLDQQGNQHNKLNENVLIEIGAAIAFYEKRVILLCQKGLTLPSNLQGLYRCEYEGEQLDYSATMKLLKTFNEFRN
jgi:predicted nucleotide-binding protein